MWISRLLDFVIPSRLRAARIEGIVADMASAREGSLGALKAAATDIGDKLVHSFQESVVDADAANALWAKHMTDLRSTYARVWKILAFLTVALPLSSLLPYHMSEANGVRTPFLAFLVVPGFAWFIVFILTMVSLDDALDTKQRFRKRLLKSAASIWALGDKAVYSISVDDVQVIRIDAIGSVARKDDDVVIRSRFGEPTATLFAGFMEKSALDEIVSNLKSRIS
ncbi:hypothetical protein G6L37_07090 [Agrobacterium rubi]|nr:hypothetical protein [Agrobacterium rubi]NTF25131.1 hypothetical protein [Agrobacterium rubi]